MTSPGTLLKAWELKPKKQLGQNFLSADAAKMIVNRAEISADDTVLEIGAGLGALTIPAAKAAAQVYAMETDSRILDLLKTELQVHCLDNVQIMKQDILRFDMEEFVRRENIRGKLLVMGNLPYNISSQVAVQLIFARKHISRAVIMFQKELARRLVAHPGSRDYGRLSVMLRYCSDIRTVATLKAAMFYPVPKVDSEVVEIRFKEPDDPAEDEAFLFSVIKASFGQRRKTMRNALAGSELHIHPDTAYKSLETAGIDPKQRAETLTVEEFVKLSRCLGQVPMLSPVR
ncbi:MAG: 16S rRNA (adenine(1518)-N(6)/adenine(1519)-N(6))-dimethyltransferase RsmA [Desulfococcaceae bacterium]